MPEHKTLDYEEVLNMADRLYRQRKSGYAGLYKRAAEGKNSAAMFRYGYCLATGSDVPMNEEEAFYWYEQAAKAENKLGLYYAATCLARGIGCSADMERALLYARKAARQGYKDADLLIREIESCRERFPGEDVKPARECMAEDLRQLRKVISRIVNRSFRNELYLANLEQLEVIGPVAKADSEWTLRQMQMRAKRGDSEALLNLGLMYYELDPQEVNPDPEKGYHYLMQAAFCGNLTAMKWLVSIYAGDNRGPYLPAIDPAVYRQPQPQVHFAWNLLRMISWVHIGGLLTLEDWYENGRHIAQPDYIQALEACKSLADYHVFPKKYYTDWGSLFNEEKALLLSERNRILMSRLVCLTSADSAHYRTEALELIEVMLAEKETNKADLAALLSCRGDRLLLDTACKRDPEISRLTGEIFHTGSAFFSHQNAELEITPDFETFMHYSFLYYAKEYGFEETLQELIQELIEAYQANTAEGLLALKSGIDRFNFMLETYGVCDHSLNISSLEMFCPQGAKVTAWRERRLHSLKMRCLRHLMLGGDPKAVDQLLQEALRRYPKLSQIFPALPVCSSRPGGWTACEEMLLKNQKLSQTDFSAVDRFDVMYDGCLWEAADAIRRKLPDALLSEKEKPEIAAGVGWRIDDRIERYLEISRGKVLGYWPGLSPLPLLWLNTEDGQREAVCFSFPDTIAFPEEWKKAIRHGKMDLCMLRELIGESRYPERTVFSYIEKLLKTDISYTAYLANLQKLYRYITFRCLWWEAQYPGENEPFMKNWRMLYQALTKERPLTDR